MKNPKNKKKLVRKAKPKTAIFTEERFYRYFEDKSQFKSFSELKDLAKKWGCRYKQQTPHNCAIFRTDENGEVFEITFYKKKKAK